MKKSIKLNKNIPEGSAKEKQPYPRIALIGFRGVGKSSIGQKLSDIWETNYISLDSYIEKKLKSSVVNIFREKGCKFFREQEELSLKEIYDIEKPPVLLDTGGGIIEGPDESKSLENIKMLKKKFFTIHLFIFKEEILNRLQNMDQGSHRPQLDGHIGDIYDRRQAWYQEASSAIINVTNTIEEESLRRVIKNI